MQRKVSSCPCHPRAASSPRQPCTPLERDLSPAPIASPLPTLATHSEMISGGRFLGTALESTQKAVSRVQEQLGGHGGGRGGRRPPAGSQSQAKARRRRAESCPFGILLPRRSSITPWGGRAPPLGAVPSPLAVPGAAAKPFSSPPSTQVSAWRGRGGCGRPSSRAAAHHAPVLRGGGREGRREGCG